MALRVLFQSADSKSESTISIEKQKWFRTHIDSLVFKAIHKREALPMLKSLLLNYYATSFKDRGVSMGTIEVICSPKRTPEEVNQAWIRLYYSVAPKGGVSALTPADFVPLRTVLALGLMDFYLTEENKILFLHDLAGLYDNDPTLSDDDKNFYAFYILCELANAYLLLSKSYFSYGKEGWKVLDAAYCRYKKLTPDVKNSSATLDFLKTFFPCHAGIAHAYFADSLDCVIATSHFKDWDKLANGRDIGSFFHPNSLWKSHELQKFLRHLTSVQFEVEPENSDDEIEREKNFLDIISTKLIPLLAVPFDSPAFNRPAYYHSLYDFVQGMEYKRHDKRIQGSAVYLLTLIGLDGPSPLAHQALNELLGFYEASFNEHWTPGELCSDYGFLSMMQDPGPLFHSIDPKDRAPLARRIVSLHSKYCSILEILGCLRDVILFNLDVRIKFQGIVESLEDCTTTLQKIVLNEIEMLLNDRKKRNVSGVIERISMYWKGVWDSVQSHQSKFSRNKIDVLDAVEGVLAQHRVAIARFQPFADLLLEEKKSERVGASAHSFFLTAPTATTPSTGAAVSYHFS